MYTAEEINIKNELFECFVTNYEEEAEKEKKKLSKLTLKDKKYHNKARLNIVDTFIVDNNQFIAWLFTDKNGFVMCHSKDKLNKDNVLLYFLSEIKRYIIDVIGIKAISKIKNEKILSDLEIFSNSINLKISPEILYKNKSCDYLIHFHKMKCILVQSPSEVEKKKFMNIIEFSKAINDNNKFSSVKLIQSFIDIKVHNNFHMSSKYKELSSLQFQTMNITYTLSKEGKKSIKMFIENPKHLSDQQKNPITNLRSTLSRKFTTQSMNSSMHNSLINLSGRTSLNSYNSGNSSLDYNNTNEKDKIYFSAPRTPYTNTNLQSMYETIIFDLIKHIERVKHAMIYSCEFHFLKLYDDSFAFVSGCNLTGIYSNNPLYVSRKNILEEGMKKIYDKRIPPDITLFDKIKKISNEHKCQGEFCNFALPTTAKGATFINAINETMLHQKVNKENKFSERDKNYTLPNSLPLFKIKQVYDNPMIVNMILKSYCIFPKSESKDVLLQKIQKEKEKIQKSLNDNITSPTNHTTSIKISLFTDISKDSDSLVLYTPQANKFDHVNIDNMYHRVGVCYNCFIIYSLIESYLSTIDQSLLSYSNEEKAKAILSQGEKFAYNANIALSSNDNMIYKEELSEKCLRRDLMEKIKIKRNEFIERNERGSRINRLYKHIITKQDENNKMFNYYLDVNPKKFNIKLGDETIESKNAKENVTMFKVKLTNKATPLVKNKICYYKDARANSATMKNRRIHMGYSASAYDIRTKEEKQRSSSIKSKLSMMDIDIMHNLKAMRNSLSLSNNDTLIKKKEKKIHLTSIFYSKNFERVEKNIPYYLISTPIAKFKDGNHIITNDTISSNLLSITPNEYCNIVNMKMNSFLSSSEIFLYDNYTAIPYKIKSIYSKSIKAKSKIILFVFNDFFDSYDKYIDFFLDALTPLASMTSIDIVFFNLPGQAYTSWSHRTILNNAFYIDFFDRFLFHLYHKKKIFDDTFDGFLVGFGNGGFIALSYLTVYEKYCSFIKGCLCFNSFIHNDAYMNRVMNELYRKAKKENANEVNDFVRTVFKSDEDIQSHMNNVMYRDIIRGYRYNINILSDNVKRNQFGVNEYVRDIIAPIVLVNAINDTFVNVNNVEKMADISKKENVLIIDDVDDYLTHRFKFDSIIRAEKEEKPRRFMIKINTDAHDMINYTNSTIHIITNIINNFFNDYIAVNKANKSI